jgi:hypothetical protein|tara:strand:+ start:745 stop:960 length:216 start_codon:yes stop_codon:yes gene_type:complete
MGISVSRMEPDKKKAKQKPMSNKEIKSTRDMNKNLQGKKKGAKIDNKDLAEHNRARGRTARTFQKRTRSYK